MRDTIAGLRQRERWRPDQLLVIGYEGLQKRIHDYSVRYSETNAR